MKTLVVACRTVEDELRAAMAKTGTDFPVEWLESGLHNTPRRLNARLAEVFSALDADRVLLAMGFCGNSLAGLRAGAFELVIPRADDCITLLLGSVARRMEIGRRLAAYFLTEGWLRGERNLWTEYQYTVEQYGEETARELSEMLYGHYRTLGLLDAGVKPMAPLREAGREIAEALHLKAEVVPATLSWLEALLTGPWEEPRFFTKAPGEEILSAELRLPAGA